jgi:hypothetical protein
MALEQVLGQIVRRLRALEQWREAILEPTNSCCLLARAAAQSIPDATPTAILFTTEERDLDGLHDGVNTDRITILVPGVYVVSGHAYYAQDAGGGQRTLLIYDGATPIAAHTHNAETAAGYISVATQYTCAAADILRLYFYQDSGGALDVQLGRFQATRIA